MAFHGACHGQREFEPLVDNHLRVIGSARATMLDHDLASEAFTAAHDEAQTWQQAPHERP